MVWRIGMDEAGYGPNLGPLVMTAVACQVPDKLAEANLWEVLAAAVRRRPADGDTRVYVDDSKQVYSSARGLGELETAVLAALALAAHADEPFDRLQHLGHVLELLCPEAREEIRRETWFTGQTRLPVAAETNLMRQGWRGLVAATAACGMRWGPLRSVVVCPARFNDLVDRWGSKGAVLAVGLDELLRWHLNQATNGSVHVVVDKHGGRNFYSSLVQEAVYPGMVVAREEGAQRSVYEVMGLDRLVRLTFLPRADAGDFCVAVASMISKYLRELFMAEFNAFWQKELPGVAPTAGYPGDAARFFEAILPARRRLGIADRDLWRVR